jgi:hypothetical protein
MPQSTWGFISDDVYNYIIDIEKRLHDIWECVASSMPTDTDMKYRAMDKIAALQFHVYSAQANDHIDD